MSIRHCLTLPCGLTLKNRLVKAAMTEGLADPYGRPSTDLIHLYERWARGGTGLLLTGNVIVDRLHLERAGNVVFDRAPDALMRERLAAWAKASKQHGASIWAQLSHAGRQTPIVINQRPHAPSEVPVRFGGRTGAFGMPRAMQPGDITSVESRFIQAAVIAQEAGFDGVQVHGAHGYLLSSFLSPLTNKRVDDWGGSLERRAELLLRIVRGIRAAVGPSFGVGVKLNSADFQRGGFDIDDSVKVAQWLDEAGIDLLEISGGNYESPRMVDLKLSGAVEARPESRQAYFLEFAPRIKQSLKRAALMVTGGFRSRAVMDSALLHDGVDLIGIARPLCGMPDASDRLLSGALDSLPAFEDRLRLGPGLLGPRSRFALIRALNAAGAQAWFYEQICRLGAGLEFDARFNILLAKKKSSERNALALQLLDSSAP